MSRKIRIYQDTEATLGTVIRRIKVTSTGWVRGDSLGWRGGLQPQVDGRVLCRMPQKDRRRMQPPAQTANWDGYLTVEAGAFLTASVRPRVDHIAGSADSVHELLMTRYRGATDAV